MKVKNKREEIGWAPQNPAWGLGLYFPLAFLSVLCLSRDWGCEFDYKRNVIKRKLISSKSIQEKELY